jgi:hypothetical protein
VLISPGGVNPYERMAYFVRQLALSLGSTKDEAAKAERVHRALWLYYSNGKGYDAAQALVNKYKSEPWFERFRTNDVWPEGIGAGGRIMLPAELARAWKEKPAEYGFYSAPSLYADYQPIYQALDRPTLIVQGSADSKVLYTDSNAAFAAAFAKNGNHAVEYKLFDGAEHGIFDGDAVRPAYLDFISAWVSQHFGVKPRGH